VFIKNNSFILSGAADVLFFAGFNNAHTHAAAEKHESGWVPSSECFAEKIEEPSG